MKARVARTDGGVLVLFEGATTQSKAYREEARKAFRQALRDVGPSYDSFQVRIWIEGYRRGRRIDVDNIAKACLDALVGLVWRDDRQVTRLVVEKLAEGPDRVIVAADKSELADRSASLDALLAAAAMR